LVGEQTDNDHAMAENEQLMTIVDEVVRRLEPLLRPATEPDAEYLTLQEVARRTSFSYDFVYDAVRRGDLPATKKGRDWRVAVKDMRTWMERDRVENAVPTRSQLKKKVNRLMPGLVA
jgi:excisionase family DNA binding protein